MRALPVFILVVVAGRAIADEPALALKEFTSKEGAFSVMLPGEPTAKTNADKNGGPDEHQFTLAANKDVYFISYRDVPELQNAAKDVLLKTLVTAQGALLSAANGNLLEMRELTLEKQYPGREFKFSAPIDSTTGYCTSRVYLANGRLYMLMVEGSKEFLSSKEAKQFLDSFKLVK